MSRAAVSKVIRNASGVSPAMRERVHAAVAKLDYRPNTAARAMRGSSYTLGIEMPSSGTCSSPRSSREPTKRSRERRTSSSSRPPTVRSTARSRPWPTGRWTESSPSRRTSSPAWLERLAGRIPLVMLGRHDVAMNYDNVVGDDVFGARAVMEHLLGLGHRRIAHLTERPLVTEPGSGSPHALRLETYQECMTAAGHGALMEVARTGPSDDGAYDATVALLAQEQRPTAIFASHDQLAIGALAAIADCGLSAHDVSLVGYDNAEALGPPGDLPQLRGPIWSRDGQRSGHDASRTDQRTHRTAPAPDHTHPSGSPLQHSPTARRGLVEASSPHPADVTFQQWNGLPVFPTPHERGPLGQREGRRGGGRGLSGHRLQLPEPTGTGQPQDPRPGGARHGRARSSCGTSRLDSCAPAAATPSPT